MKRCPPQLKEFIIEDDETAERLIQAMKHPVALPDPPPGLKEKFEEGRKAMKKYFGGNNNDDDESNDAK